MDDPVSTNPYAAPTASGVPFAHPGQHSVSDLSGLGWLLFSFNGRIPRRHYWGGNLLVFLIALGVAFGLMMLFGEDAANLPILVLQLVLLWASFALETKRWHDRDKSAAWLLIRLIPVIGWIWAFVELGLLRGTPGDNRYGPAAT